MPQPCCCFALCFVLEGQRPADSGPSTCFARSYVHRTHVMPLLCWWFVLCVLGKTTGARDMFCALFCAQSACCSPAVASLVVCAVCWRENDRGPGDVLRALLCTRCMPCPCFEPQPVCVFWVHHEPQLGYYPKTCWVQQPVFVSPLCVFVQQG